METILVTGGIGFIGTNLVASLLSKYNVVIVDNFTVGDYKDWNIKFLAERYFLGKLEIYHYDIENFYSLTDVFKSNTFKAVVHLAARAGVRKSFEQPLQYINTNIQGTANVLECMRRFNCNKIVFASSSSVYGNCKANTFSEDIIDLNPISVYAMTKLSGENLCKSYSDSYGINATALRFFTVYGPRQRPDLAISQFTWKIMNNKPITMYGDGTSSRDYTYIDDIVNGIEKAIDYNKTKFEAINLGSGNPVLLIDMIKTLEKYTGKNATIIQEPLQKGDVDRTCCNWEKAHRLLGFTPKFSFEDGIREYIEYIKKDGGMV